MDIYLREKNGAKTRFTFPSLPENIQVGRSTNYQSFKTLSPGSLKIPRGMSPSEVSWKGNFFGYGKRNEPIVQHWTAPEDCIDQLSKWQEQGIILNLIITDTKINMDVTIGTFDYAPFGAFGSYEYSISLSQYRQMVVYTAEEKQLEAFKDVKETRPSASSPVNNRTHTVVYGDTLWGLAIQYYGNGLEWQKLYNANRDVMDQEAQKRGYPNCNNGNYIWVGTVLVIP